MKYGCIADTPDFRDHIFSNGEMSLSTKKDLRSKMPPVYDQGQLGSCTANALGGAVEYDIICQSQGEWTPSRLFIYYNERAMEGTIQSDAGAQIRDGIKTLAKQGVCHETLWPYTISKFTEQPITKAYTDAIKYIALKYARVTQTLPQMKSCLNTGIPIVLGISVYSSFESADVAKTGMVPMPQANESLLGGHAVLCVGYDDSIQRFIMRNSWGSSWGDKGYFYIPYNYLLNPDLCSDMWAINLVK